ncbi:hypothetical protein V1478_015810 [Vespula squamosa]|uniref:Uncharacterized protein n=1 Tax=Vespula squamosa TaxID=30214 RepID=A0ABD2A4A7_VESSQ
MTSRDSLSPSSSPPAAAAAVASTTMTTTITTTTTRTTRTTTTTTTKTSGVKAGDDVAFLFLEHLLTIDSKIRIDTERGRHAERVRK